MSALFHVTNRGQFVKFSFSAGKRIYELVGRAEATSFTDEGDAWLAAYQHQLKPDNTAVVNANQVPEAA